MTYVIRLLDDGNSYLKAFDPEFTEDPTNPRTGLVEATRDPSEAMTFPTFAEAMELWRFQSVTRPLRPDGHPNRPLSAFSITIEEIPAHLQADPRQR